MPCFGETHSFMHRHRPTAMAKGVLPLCSPWGQDTMPALHESGRLTKSPRPQPPRPTLAPAPLPGLWSPSPPPAHWSSSHPGKPGANNVSRCCFLLPQSQNDPRLLHALIAVCARDTECFHEGLLPVHPVHPQSLTQPQQHGGLRECLMAKLENKADLS